MDEINYNLTNTQLGKDGRSQYAVFLPATSGFYATFIGKQRYSNYVDPLRVPSAWKSGVESLNYLNPTDGEFYYNWCLYSAGHANLDLSKPDENEDMFRKRDRTTSWVLGDSGGFQIGKGVWEGEWRDPTSQAVLDKMQDCIARKTETRKVTTTDKNGKLRTKTITVDLVKEYQNRLDAAQKKREQVLAWMDALMDYGMCLDIPAWVERSSAGRKATGICSYTDAVNATIYNNEYFIKHRNGNCKFLNVLQGETHTEADDWYQKMKHFCDPTVYPDNHFNGWAMGGQNMCDVELVLKRLVALKFDKLLEEGKHDWMHFLGTSKLEWAVLLTSIQRSIRKYHNPNFTITFDCASPFLATANGQIYIQTELENDTKWVYRMVSSADDKKYATDTRLFKDAVIQDKIFDNFETSPIIDKVQMKDICIYAPGDLNKVGKEGKTSWDSFSYAIQMGHNVYAHINAVQRANQAYDNGIYPNMLVESRFEKIKFCDAIDEIFSAATREDALAIIKKYESFWITIIGTRGATGKKIINTKTTVNRHFEQDDSGFNDAPLTALEDDIKEKVIYNATSMFNNLFD